MSLLDVGCLYGAGVSKSFEVPAEIEGGIVFVKASLNGAEPMIFILDSGATETVVTPHAAVKLRIRTLGRKGMQRGKVQSLAVGKATVRNLGVFVFDPPQALSLRLDKGINYSGILGYSFLSQFETTIDYAKSKVHFSPVSGKKRKPDPEGAHVIPFELKNRLIHANGAVSGKGPVVFVVDTGSTELLLLPKVAEKLGVEQKKHPEIEGVGFSTLKQVTLGKAVVEDVSSIVHILPQDNKSQLSYHGIIGYPFLSKFKVTINYKKKIIILK